MPVNQTITAINTDVLTAVSITRHKELVQQMYDKHALLDYFNKKCKKEYNKGNSDWYPSGYRSPTQTTHLSTGNEPIDLSQQDSMILITYDTIESSIRPVIINEKEIALNTGEVAVMKILDNRHKEAYVGLIREINRQLLGGQVSGSQLISLHGGATSPSDGFLDLASFGSQTGTIGGLEKSSYTDWWQNQYGEVTAFGADGLTVLRETETACNMYASTGQIDLHLTNPTAYENYRRVLSIAEQYVNEETLDGGRKVLHFSGVPVEKELDFVYTLSGTQILPADDGGIWIMLNSESWDWVIHPLWDPDEITPFVKAQNNVQNVALIRFMGQIQCKELKANGIVKGVDTY